MEKMQNIESLKEKAKKNPEWRSLMTNIPANNLTKFFSAAMKQIESDALN